MSISIGGCRFHIRHFKTTGGFITKMTAMNEAKLFSKFSSPQDYQL